ncbi:Rho GTPase activator [Papiliotrema laurentii]|uniref:Rho GTPase activator n=1 Tax=Papiliotrema laurentii TaxID=5418 RepID=A0AAD9FVX5_PAPLA|nr:Rho GTPase activator [Papiliotrema laurentii]
MVSARPPPAPARGRIPYPSAASYLPGDTAHSPAYLRDSEPVHPTTSRDSDKERAQGLKTWWKSFRDRPEPIPRAPGVFGIPLDESVRYASVQISTQDQDGSLHIWGVIPVVVAKCGLYLKENATEVEGTFRISGSSKRMRDLQAIFDNGPKYGKNIDWRSLPYTSHDVATIFRRFLTQMPEPIIPYNFYQTFRQSLQPDHEAESISTFKSIIGSLPPLNRYLLLYVLDLLHVFAEKSDKNLMTAANLALIFQPGVLSHPDHAMRPREHVLSQQVLEFLISHQDDLLFGLQPEAKHTGSGEREREKQIESLGTPTRTKADPDLMIPSESDSDAPPGGYYVIESGPRPTTSRKIARRVLSPRSDSQGPPRSPQPASAVMDPSDSDEDVPPGGYHVREGDPAKTRAALLSRNRTASKKRTEDPAITASGLSRRQTVPARLFGQRGLGMRPRTREAP